MSNNENKKFRSGWGILLGVLGILVAFLCGLLFGLPGGIVAGVLGLAAVVIGIIAMKKGSRGMGALIAGILAIVLAYSVTSFTGNLIEELQSKAKQYAEEAPLVAKYIGDAKTNNGLYGIFANIPKNEADVQQFSDELSKLLKIEESETTEQTPAETKAE